MLDTPELPVVALPTPSEQFSLAPTLSVPLPVVTSTQKNKPLLVDQNRIAYTPAQPLLCGLIPVVLLVFGIIIVIRLRERYKG